MMSLNITTLEFRTKIQQTLSAHKIRRTPESQMVKDFLLKGWSYKSAESLAKHIKKMSENVWRSSS